MNKLAAQSRVQVRGLYEECHKSLVLKWVAGHSGAERTFGRTAQEGKDAAGFVGYFNLIHQSQIQILGIVELHYIQSLGQEEQKSALDKLFSPETVTVVVADGCELMADFTRLADERHIGLFSSPVSGVQILSDIQYHLNWAFAPHLTMHGVFMEVISTGVLLSGDSGVGKSELALQLVTRGSRLIADDAPHFARISPNIIVGKASPIIKDFLEVRGLGVLDIQKMYGDSSIKDSKYLKLIIKLKNKQNSSPEIDRLQPPATSKDVLGVTIPLLTLPIAPGWNLAVLVEAAVRNHILTLKGHCAHALLTARQKQFLERQ